MGPAGRAPFSPRPGAELASESVGVAGFGVSGGGAVVNQARQQKEKAQKTRYQCRRIAWSARTMKSAQPSSCLSCL
jgi:hypothetical protein